MGNVISKEQYKKRYEIDTRYNASADDFDNMYSLRNNHGLLFETERLRQIFTILNKNRITFENKTILDIGCNFGFYTNILACLKRSTNDIYGVDFIENMVNKAKKINNKINYSQQDIYKGLNFKDSFFDFILVNYMLNCITEHREKVFHTIGSKVKIGGHILFFDFLGDEGNIVYYIEGLLKFKNPYKHVSKRIKRSMSYHLYPRITCPEINKYLPNFKIRGFSRMDDMRERKKNWFHFHFKNILQRLIPAYNNCRYCTILVERIS